MLRSSVRALLLTAFFMALTGCASLRASAARQAHIDNQTQAHVYGQPIDQTWPAARQILFEMGYQVRESDPGVYALETEWLRESDQSYSRYLVQGIPFEDSQSQIQFLIDQRVNPNASPNTGRDLGVEFSLIQRLDPDAAARIQREADAEADRVYNQQQ